MANTFKGRKFFICETPQAADLDAAGYAALTWVQVGNVGEVGDTGLDVNIVSYDELDTEVTAKQKGIADAGEPTIEVARNATDVGQIAMRTAAATKYIYAFKIENADAPSASFTNSIFYNRGLITGPLHPGGRNEDFELEQFKLGLVQAEISVNPVAQVVPTVVNRPSVRGSDAVLNVGDVVTAEEGTWTNSPTSYTYQWMDDTAGNGTFANINGATSKTYTLAAGQSGDSVCVEVTAVNGAGSSTAARSIGTHLVAA